MDPQTLISKLQSQAADSLAALCVESMLDAPVGNLIPTALVISTARKALAGWLDSPNALSRLNSLVESVANRLAEDRRSVKEIGRAHV